MNAMLAERTCDDCGKNIRTHAIRSVVARTVVRYDMSTRWETKAVCEKCRESLTGRGWERR